MNDGIIQKVIAKRKISTHNYRLDYDVNDFNIMLSQLEQELIEEIKKVMHPRYEDEYSITFEAMQEILIGDNQE